MMWEEFSSQRNWEFPKNTPNDNNYHYYNNNRQYIKENYAHTQHPLETNNKPSINQVNNSRPPTAEIDNQNPFYLKNTYKEEIKIQNPDGHHQAPSYFVSKTGTSSPCSNLYVDPPFFTVDKFVNAAANTQNNNEHYFDPKQGDYPPSNGFKYKTMKKQENILLKNKDLLRVKVIGNNNNIPLIHVESSTKPIDKYNHAPIMRRYCENDLISFENSKNSYVECTCNSKFKKDFIQNNQHNYLSIHHQCNCRGGGGGGGVVKLKNQQLYRIADLNAPESPREVSQHGYELNDLHNMDFQRNPMQNSIKTCPTSGRNIVRDSTGKPNYRELINNAHAWKSLTSEDDLNMEIIKRTLNYNQIPKGFPNNFPPPRNQSYQAMRYQKHRKSFTEGDEVKVFDEKPIESVLQHEASSLKVVNTIAPLDLSLKTIKPKVYPSESKAKHYNQFQFERGYPPPKQNFEPNFYEEQNTNHIKHIKSEHPKPLPTEQQSPVCHCNTSVEIHMPRYFTDCCNHLSGNISHNKKKVVNCSLGNELTIEASADSDLRGNVIYSVQNCIYPQIMPTFFRNKNEEAGIEVEVTLKRSIPFSNAESNEIPEQTTVDHRLERRSDVNDCCGGGNLHPNLTKTTKIDTKPNVCDIIPSENLLKIEQQKQVVVQACQIKPEPSPTSQQQTNQDVSSIIAARIRTKAELKGFIFQDPVNVVNIQTSEQDSEQSNELDLNMWLTDCNKFVNQLMQTCEKKELEKTISPSLPPPTPPPSILNTAFNNNAQQSAESPVNNNSSPNRKREFEEVSTSTTTDPIPLKQIKKSNSCLEINLNVDDENTASTEKTDKIDLEYKSITTDSNANISPPKSADICKTFSELDGDRENSSKECVQNNQSERLIESNSVVQETNNKQNEQSLEINRPRTIDLTKVSVVRLKRENYKTYSQCPKKVKLNFRTNEKMINEEATVSTNPDPDQNGKHLPKKSTTPLENSICKRSKQQTHTDKFNSIKTRLRPKMVQSKTESKDKNKRNGFKKNKNVIRCFQKTNEHSNDPEKLYLEVYRFKRALKIPPNLITIKNNCAENVSTSSLPDPDFDQDQNTQKIKENNYNNSAESGKGGENIPRSIIDVLHSRFLKSKSQANLVQKLFKKGSNQFHNTRHTQQSPNITKSDFDAIDVNKNVGSHLNENRNVFETQVIPSRTRREYKVQLNKEIIREIFGGGTDRPASAPPELSAIETTSKSSENSIFPPPGNEPTQVEMEEEKHNQTTSADENLITDFESIKEQQQQQPDNSKQHTKISKILDISKRKKRRKMYRRRFSSGFDYLRKRKRNTNPKSKTTLFKYSNLKANVAKESAQIKNEIDVSKEIQKWVLNKGVGQSALHKAARLGYTDVIVYCLEKMGLHPDHKDNAGYTPLHEACVNGSFDIVKILMQYGANHSEGALSGIRPIHEASENGYIEILRMLLSFGADPLLETYAGQTPLMLASDSEVIDFISMHLIDVQVTETNRRTWKFPGPWNLFDEYQDGCDAFNDISSLNFLYHMDKNLPKKHCLNEDVCFLQSKKKNLATNAEVGELRDSQNSYLKNDVREYEVFIDTANADGELFEFEESAAPLPPLYLLKDEGMDKWVLLNDLCNLLKVKSKDTLLHKIFPSYQIAAVSRAYLRELKMCEFLERATCLQLLCAGEKINICHSKVVLIKYNENVRSLLGVKTIMMKL